MMFEAFPCFFEFDISSVDVYSLEAVALVPTVLTRSRDRYAKVTHKNGAQKVEEPRDE